MDFDTRATRGEGIEMSHISVRVVTARRGDRSDSVILELEPKDHETFWELHNTIWHAIETSGVGEYDGYEIPVHGLLPHRLFLYGSNASNLFKAVLPFLENNPRLQNIVAILFRRLSADQPLGA